MQAALVHEVAVLLRHPHAERSIDGAPLGDAPLLLLEVSVLALTFVVAAAAAASSTRRAAEGRRRQMRRRRRGREREGGSISIANRSGLEGCSPRNQK